MQFLVIFLSVLLSLNYVAGLWVPQSEQTYDAVTKVPHLLGQSKCTWGPSFWCSNITNANACNAVKHCIKTDWEHRTPPPDNDSVCEICTKMVAEARAQLESNQTQEELKEVFEGSCKLIPLSVISNECIKLVDEFIPDLVETLASQMNPQMVCTVAGLCNNARIDKLLEEQKMKVKVDDCEGCRSVVQMIKNNFDKATRDQVLQGLLNVCGHMSSFSDACTNIILNNFDDIYNHIEVHLKPRELCVLSGSCYLNFHQHKDVIVEITPLAESGLVEHEKKDDLPCELCEQLVKHLRDLLIANTTEDEFQKVLQGLCKQTGKFKDECLSLVNEYYPEIYNFLVTELDSKKACVMVGICVGDKITKAYPFSPLLPVETADKAIKISEPEKEKHIGRVSVEKGDSNIRVISAKDNVKVVKPELVQLPIERMMPPSLTLMGNTQFCAMCQYFLHFVQNEITSPKTEEKIKTAVREACDKLPSTIANECTQFVDTYGDAFVALLAQEIDPSQICPLLSLCPADNLQEVEVLIHSKPKDKPNCPLCLFAVTQLENMIKDHKTEDSIRNALNGLCKHLPKNLAPECEDFVQTYTKELVEMLIADLSPQEVCVYLKLCDDKPVKAVRPWVHITGVGEFESEEINNEIADDTIEGKVVKKGENLLENARSPQCVICEFIMSEIEKELKDRKNEEHVKHIVHNICNILPKSVSKDCNDFVDKYGDMVIQLLIQSLQPSEVCSVMALCSSRTLRITEEVFECAICESAINAIDKLLQNPNVDHKMEHVLKKACLALPSHAQEKCKGMIDAYGDSFFKLISKLENSSAVCHKVGLCANEVLRPKRSTLLGADPCTWGPSFWCSEKAVGTKCQQSEKYCQDYLAKTKKT